MARGRPPSPGPLTPAGERVLEHVRLGQSNAGIAVRLGVSVNTVRYHVSNLLSKAGMSERQALAAWKPDAKSPAPQRFRRPVLLWLAASFAGVAGVAAGFVALPRSEPSPEPPAGFRVYSAGELTALGMEDQGPVFDVDDGLPVAAHLREGAVVVNLPGPATVALRLAGGASYGTDSAYVTFVSPAGGPATVAIYASGGPRLELERTSGAYVARINATGPAQLGLRVQRAGALASAAIDGRGHLFVSPAPADAAVPIDDLTGSAVGLASLEPVATGWFPEVGTTRCDPRCRVMIEVPAVFTSPGNGMRAPFAGLLSCEPDGAYSLTDGVITLRLSRIIMEVGGHSSRCEGPVRRFARGALFDFPGRWEVVALAAGSSEVAAFDAAGRQLDVALSRDGSLYIGENLAPNTPCPCVHGN